MIINQEREGPWDTETAGQVRDCVCGESGSLQKLGGRRAQSYQQMHSIQNQGCSEDPHQRVY